MLNPVMTSNHNKRYFKDLDKKSKYHDSELKKLNKDKTKILTKEGFKDKPHIFIWILVIIAIVIAVIWYLFIGY